MNINKAYFFISSKIFGFLLLALCLAIPQLLSAQEGGRGGGALSDAVFVRDFGAVPGDDKCDMQAVKMAISEAVKTGAKRLVFDAGVYDIFVKDAEKFVFVIKGAKNLSVEGAASADGTPLTKIVRHYKMAVDIDARAIFQVSECENFRLKNMIFDNSPRYFTAGEVVSNDGKNMLVRIFDGNPLGDGTLLFCSNLWDIKTRNLKHVPSPTFGGEGVTKRAGELTVRAVPEKGPNVVKISSETVAAHAAVGDGLSWNFGWRGSQLSFLLCRNLYFENVFTYSSMGFCIFVGQCENIYAKNVRFKAQDNQFHVGSRDAFMISSCSGKVIMDGLYVEGVRWDGQNVNSLLLWPEKILDPHTAVFSNHFRGGRPMPKKGSKIGFFINPDEEEILTVESCEPFEGSPTRPKKLKIRFKEEMPDTIDAYSTCSLYGQIPLSYTLLNSTFRNIAGCASLIRQNDVLIKNCVYDNIMYPAICIGASLHEDEGPVSRNIRVENSRFISSGWQARHGALGCIGVKLAKTRRLPPHRVPYICNVKILNNSFEDSDIGIDADRVLDFEIRGNTFANVKNPILQNDCEEVSEADNKIKNIVK